MEVAARPAVADDLPRVVELLACAGGELRPTRGGELFFRREAREVTGVDDLVQRLDAPDGVMLVGTIDGFVVGVGSARAEALRDGGRLALLDELYVEPEAREVGVGEALMDGIVAWAEAGGCEGIDATVLPGNRESKNFFESYGLTARAIVVHRDLGGAR